MKAKFSALFLSMLLMSQPSFSGNGLQKIQALPQSANRLYQHLLPKEYVQLSPFLKINVNDNETQTFSIACIDPKSDIPVVVNFIVNEKLYPAQIKSIETIGNQIKVTFYASESGIYTIGFLKLF